MDVRIILNAWFFLSKMFHSFVGGDYCVCACSSCRCMFRFQCNISTMTFVQVPLWLAVHLRSQNKCVITPPHWMEIRTTLSSAMHCKFIFSLLDALKDLLKRETDDPDSFETLPVKVSFKNNCSTNV